MHAQHTFHGKLRSCCEVWDVCSKFCVFWMLLQRSVSRMLCVSVEARGSKEAVKFHSVISILLATWFSLSYFRVFNSAVVANSYHTWDVDVCKRVDVISWVFCWCLMSKQRKDYYLWRGRPTCTPAPPWLGACVWSVSVCKVPHTLFVSLAQGFEITNHKKKWWNALLLNLMQTTLFFLEFKELKTKPK